jgi:itaconyl-CoA hydratase
MGLALHLRDQVDSVSRLFTGMSHGMNHIDIAHLHGPFFEDLDVGFVHRSEMGRTVTEFDNVLFTSLTLNSNQIHFNRPFAEASRFGQILVNSTFTLALVTGLSVPGTSVNAVANLGWDEVQLPRPVFVGDTIWAESEVIDRRESKTDEGVGIVKIRTRGVKQDGSVIIEFLRTFMVPKRDSPAARHAFPPVTSPWQVGETDGL